MENVIELTKEFWEWLWKTDKQSYALILMGHTELIDVKHKEYEQVNKESEEEE